MGLFKRLIRWASVVRSGTDTGQFPVQQVVYLGKTADAIMVFPYGMHANVDGNSIGPLVLLNGNDENRAMVPTSMTRRSTLGSGDVEIYSPVSRSRVTIRANGDVEVDAANITATASGDLTATVTGSVAVTASAATVTAPTVTLDSATVSVTGNLTVTGTITGGNITTAGTLTQGGKDVGASHVHSGVSTGPSNTGTVV